VSTDTKTYVEQIAKIRSVKLGWEDHGIFTCMVDLDYGGSGQGAGGYCLDEPRHADGEFIGRFGTAFGMQWIIRLMRAVGVEDFSQIKGKTVIALRDERDDGYNAKVVGLKPLPFEKGEEFLFEELSIEFGHRS
jgi:hypothetical protein